VEDHQDNVSLAMNDTGRFVAIWTSRDQDGSNDGVFGQLFSTNAAPQIDTDAQSIEFDEGQLAVNSGTFSDLDIELGDGVTVTSSIGTITQTPGNAGVWNWSYQTTDGPDETQSVTITATDSRGFESSLGFDLDINNVAPTATIQVPTHVLKNETKTYTFSADDVSVVDDSAGFTYHIDWDGDGSFDQMVTGGTTVYVDHVFTAPGDVTIFATATDKDGGISEVASQALSIIQPVEIDVRSVVNLNSNGVIAVSIFTTEDFDAATIDSNSAVFANALAIQSALEDLDGDGDLDMVLHFRTQDTNLEEIYAQLLLDDENEDGVLDSTSQEAEAFLTGTTYDDVLIEGSDSLDLFLRGRALRELLDELFAEPAI